MTGEVKAPGSDLERVQQTPPIGAAPRVSTWVERLLQLQRGGIVMTADGDRPEEAGGVLNPASARSRHGELYIFPRLVAEGNYSRVGIATVRFDPGGEPVGVVRQGIALEPAESYERRGPGVGGVEDPRVTYLPLLDVYVMTYVALGPESPHVALAVSHDLHTWQRLGLMQFEPIDGIDFGRCDNKDAVVFPLPVTDPEGNPAYAILHRPIYRVPIPRDGVEWLIPPGVTDIRPSIWISYAPVDRVDADLAALTRVGKHQLLANPLSSWEHHHIGSGAPPILCEEGWLLYYHGVLGLTSAGVNAPSSRLIYQTGVMLLDRDDPRRILYRSATPILLPDRPEEQHGVVPNVVFPTAVDVRGSRIDVYYGAADACIGVATTHVSASRLLAPSAPTNSRQGVTSLAPSEAVHRPAETVLAELLATATEGSGMRVKDIMTRDVGSVAPNASLAEAAHCMLTADARILPVVDGDEVVGVITDRDMTIRAVAAGTDPRATTAADVMSTQVLFCYEDNSIDEALDAMASNRVRRLIVLDRARQLAGIVSLDDIAHTGEHGGLVAEALKYASSREDGPSGRFERILVALDGSAFAESVLDAVVPLAKRLGAELILLRAVVNVASPVGASIGERHPNNGAPPPSNGHGEVGRYLSEVRERLEVNGLQVRTEAPVGSASSTILRSARQLDVDLIALTTHGRTGMDRVLMGSVAEDVVRRAPCPVLLIRALPIW